MVEGSEGAGELLFVGMGLYDEKDLGRRAWEALRGCDTVFAEEYTSVLRSGSIDRLAGEIGRPIQRLTREEVEAERTLLDALAGGRRVALLVAGDPFAATTHVALRRAVEERHHRWSYFPNASVLTAAAGFLGLQLYRFGRTVSLPMPEPGFAPTSPWELLAANRSAGLHTLVLLDLRPSEGRFLTGAEAIRLLRARDPDARWWPRDAELAVVARVGGPDAQAWVGTADALGEVDFGPPLHSLVVLAPTLHFEETAALAAFRWPRAVEPSG